jgi:predicted enzyme related to lactoylglutathione lyase
MTATIRIELFPRDLSPVIDFYVRALDFRLERTSKIPYASLRRDGIRIGLRAAERDVDPVSRQVPHGTEIVFEVADLEGEKARILSAGYSLAEDLRTRSWGLRDFRVFDPAGYYLRLTTAQ